MTQVDGYRTRVPVVHGPALAPGTVAGVRSPSAHLRLLLAFVKPHIDLTFVIVGITGSLLAWHDAGRLPVVRILMVAASVALLSAGAECWTNLHDRDIDSRMPRTAARPLVTGQISVREAALLGTAVTVAGLALAAALGAIPFLFLALALLNNVVIYSILAKRSTPWSIVLGSVVAPLTLWAGYAAVRLPIAPAAVLLGSMAGVWVFVHIWLIAIRYRDDYSLGGVPMAPLVWSRAQLTAALAASGMVMGAMAVGAVIGLGGPAGRWAALPVGLASALILAGAVLVPRRQRLAGPMIRAVTFYLVFVLGMAIGIAI